MKKLYAGMAVLSLAFASPGAYAQTNPGFLSYWYWTDTGLPVRYTNSPWVGDGSSSSANDQIYKDIFADQIADGKPTGMMIREGQAPVTGASEPTALATVIGWVQSLNLSLNYVVADLENSDPYYHENDMTSMVTQVRASSDPDVNGAYVGNYGYTASATDWGAWRPSAAQSTTLAAKAQVYSDSGVDISMPVNYGNSTQGRHTDTGEWGADSHGVSPNKRAGMFYGDLERFSGVARVLPKAPTVSRDHKIIPFVGVFHPVQGYYGPVPEKADVMALLQHYRLRGADGYYVFRPTDSVYSSNWATSGVDAAYNNTAMIPTTCWLRSYPGGEYSREQFTADLLDAWDDLDGQFGTPIRTVLNLNTTKTSGVEWSGVRSERTVTILVSNLGASAVSLDLTPTEYSYTPNGLPATTSSVPAGTHALFTYTINNCVQNGNFNTDATGWALNPGCTWQSTGGDSNSGCLRFQTSQIAAHGTQYIRVEPGVKMSFSVKAKGTSSPWLKKGYYMYDANHNNLGYRLVADHQNLSSTLTTYSTTFNVATNQPGVKYIRPVFHNYDAPNDSTDVITIDQVIIRFEP